MAHVIIGTAGHVDHGKTSLIKALTGVDTDRLKEEKERGITIQLGFAYFDLPQGKKAGIVDVPGHERFVRNMLAGVGGMDIVLLVVAADEGVMPQTKEHLNILRLLNVKNGIIVVTKKDMVDEELLELAIEDIKDQVQGSFLQDSPVIAVSSVTGEGIEDLKAGIIAKSEETQERQVRDFFRLPIDRVFSLKGFGTVVTGTLKDGMIAVGDLCTLFPSEREVKIRQIQVHGQQVEAAYPGQRAAINITGVEKEDITMGDLLTTANYLRPKNKVNCILNLLEDVPELESGTVVRFHWGTEETYGRAVLLDRDVLVPGEKCYCQIRLEENVVVARDDHFVIRSMSPVDTIGGGLVLSSTIKRVPRHNEQIINDFRVRENGGLEEIILSGLKGYAYSGVDIKELATDMQINLCEIEKAVKSLIEKKHIIELRGDTTPQLIEIDHYNILASKITDILSKFHGKFPLKAGMNKEELRSKLGEETSVKFINSFLKQMEWDNLVKTEGLIVSQQGFSICLSEEDIKKSEEALERVRLGGFKPPSKGELGIKDTLIDYLVEQNKVVILEDIVYHSTAIKEAIEKMLELITANPKGVTMSDIKSVIDTSRKYLVPLLEHIDGKGITKRIGEVRVLGSKGREIVK